MPERVRIEPVEGRGMITLRGDLEAARLAEAVHAATGCAMPEVRRIETGAAGAAAWMSPDELMLFVPRASAPEAVAELGRALDGTHHLAVDVSDARALFRLRGFEAREVLAKGAPVDLAPAAFGPGDLRRTRLGQVAVAFWMPEAEVFELMCFGSVAGFVRDWLELAARPEARVGFFARRNARAPTP